MMWKALLPAKRSHCSAPMAGEWMRDWTTRMEAAGATVLNGEGLICHETPDEDGLSECRELGIQLANA